MNTGVGERIIIPRDAAELVLLQRTAHSVIGRIPGIRRLLPVVGYRPLLKMEARVRSAAIVTDYADEMEREFQELRTYLPGSVSAIVDIGCGVGGMSALLAKHYKGIRPHIHLVDRTHTERRVWYEFNTHGAFYNSLELARNVVTMNGARELTFFEVDGVSDEIGFDGCADLVISLLSWGYHYPLGFYWDRVLKVLPPSGTLIVDLRQAEDIDDGMPLIRSQFDVLAQQPIHAGVRVIARRAARANP